MIVAPLAMLVAIRPLLTEFLGGRRAEVGSEARQVGPSAGRRRAARSAGRCWRWPSSAARSTRASWCCATRRSGRPGTAPSCRPSCRSSTASRCSTPARTATPPTSCSAPTPTCRWSSSPTKRSSASPEKPFDTGDAYSPIDFDSFSHGTLDDFPYVITSRAAWNSQAPPNFKRVATTPSYVLWKRTGPTPEDRHVLLEGTEAGALAGCDSPEIRILLANRGRASLFPETVIGAKGDWDEGSVLGTGDRDLAGAGPAGRRLEPLDPVLLALRPDPQRARLRGTAEGGARRPAAEHDQPRQQRPVLAGRALREQGRHGHASRSPPPTPAPCRASPATTARPTSASWSRSAPNRTGSCRCARPAAAGSTGTPPSRCPSRTRAARATGQAQTALAARRSGETRTTSQTRPSFSRPSITSGGDVDLAAAEAVGGGGREGVVVVVPGLAEGRDRDQRQVARLVGGLEVAVAEDVAERVDAVGEVVEDEDADQAAPEQAGEAGEEGAADHPAEREGEQQADDRPVDEGAVDPADDRVLEQVGREALLVAALGVDEEPAHVGVEEAAQGAAPAVAVVDVGAVRVALLVGEGVVLAVVGDPGDDRALDRGRAEDRQQAVQPAAWP